MPLRPNPKRAESSNQAIQDAEIRRTPPRAIKNQQLLFGQNGFRDDGSHTAWLTYAHDRSHDMDKEENQITHTRFYQRSRPFYFNVIWNSPGTRVRHAEQTCLTSASDDSTIVAWTGTRITTRTRNVRAPSNIQC